MKECDFRSAFSSGGDDSGSRLLGAGATSLRGVMDDPSVGTFYGMGCDGLNDPKDFTGGDQREAPAAQYLHSLFGPSPR